MGEQVPEKLITESILLIQKPSLLAGETDKFSYIFHTEFLENYDVLMELTSCLNISLLWKNSNI